MSKVENIIALMLSLTPVERQELKQQITPLLSRMDLIPLEKKGRYIYDDANNRGMDTINFAPVPGRCPRCGK